VHCNHRDAQVRRAQGGARVKTHPAEQENEGADHHKGKVMSWKGSRLAVRTVLAEARAKDDSQRHAAEAAHAVDNGRARKIYVAVAQAEIGAQLREPAAAPDPTSEHGV